MPHIPKASKTPQIKSSSTSGKVLPAPTTQPTQAYRGGSADVGGQTGMSAVQRVSIRKFEYDPNRVFKFAFGKEPDIDEHTGRLVYPWNSAASGDPIFGNASR